MAIILFFLKNPVYFQGVTFLGVLGSLFGDVQRRSNDRVAQSMEAAGLDTTALRACISDVSQDRRTSNVEALRVRRGPVMEFCAQDTACAGSCEKQEGSRF